MNLPKKLNFIEFIEQKTLLYGTTNSYKTYITSKFVDFLLHRNTSPSEITILDFAPKIQHIKNLKIGGKVSDFSSLSLKCNYLPIKGEILPPRLKSNNKKELYYYAFRNYKKTKSILEFFTQNPTKTLIINDISIYLHLGNKKSILNIISKSNTFFGNTYYGKSISCSYSRLFNLIERKRVNYLIKNISNSYNTDWLANSEAYLNLIR